MSAAGKGRAGEECAARFLRARGWEVLERNYRTRTGEIDIICKTGPYIVFVEVKARAKNSLGTPAQAVDARKRANIVNTARAYLQEHPACGLQPRFDVLELVLEDGRAFARLLENAFDADGW